MNDKTPYRTFLKFKELLFRNNSLYLRCDHCEQIHKLNNTSIVLGTLGHARAFCIACSKKVQIKRCDNCSVLVLQDEYMEYEKDLLVWLCHDCVAIVKNIIREDERG